MLGVGLSQFAARGSRKLSRDMASDGEKGVGGLSCGSAGLDFRFPQRRGGRGPFEATPFLALMDFYKLDPTENGTIPSASSFPIATSANPILPLITDTTRDPEILSLPKLAAFA